MPTPTQGGRVPGRALLSKFARAGAMKDFLDFYAFRDTAFFIDDFLGDTINLDMYAVAKQGGTSDAVFATLIAGSGASGAISATTGTDDNNATSLIGPIIYKGDQNCGMSVRFQVNAVTSLNFEIGFIDAVPGSSGPAIADIDVVTATAADCAVLHLDTDQTLATMAFATVGSTANQTVKATTLTSVTLPTAATFMTVTVQLVGNDAFLIINDGQEVVRHANGTGNNSAGHVEGGVALAPWIYFRSRAASAARIPIVDYIATWTDRAA